MNTLRKKQIASTTVDNVPKGWKTSTQWAKSEGLSRGHTQKILKSLVESGEMERKDFRITVYDRIIPVPHYK